MKHLILDVNSVLDLWFARAHVDVLETLFDRAEQGEARLWVAASSLSAIEYLANRCLADKGMEATRRKETLCRLMDHLFEHVSILSHVGADYRSEYGHSRDFEDAQIALAAMAIHGEKVIVTSDCSFDTLGLLSAKTPEEALCWLNESDDGCTDFIDLKTQQDVLRPKIEAQVANVLKHGRYIMG
ncbi:MAG: aminotransferase, partial [Gammaproteobacteria bacterium]